MITNIKCLVTGVSWGYDDQQRTYTRQTEKQIQRLQSGPPNRWTRHGSSWRGTAMRRSGKVLLEEADEPVGGGVVGGDLSGALQLWLNLLGELLSQFHPGQQDHNMSFQPQHSGCLV